MEDCSYSSLASGYHDGELREPGLSEFRAHLVDCGPCSSELAVLRGISAGLARGAGDVPGMSPMAMARLQKAVSGGFYREALDGGLLRIAWTLSGIAAAILLAGTAWLAEVKSAPEAAPPWVSVAVNTEVEGATVDGGAANEASSVATPAAAWYLADATGRNDGLMGDR
jgi:hypothetical protein